MAAAAASAAAAWAPLQKLLLVLQQLLQQKLHGPMSREAATTRRCSGAVGTVERAAK